MHFEIIAAATFFAIVVLSFSNELKARAERIEKLEARLLAIEPDLAGLNLLEEQIELLIEELDLTLELDRPTRLRQAQLAAALYSRDEKSRVISRVAQLRILALTKTPESSN
jgi:hypothetical protein